MSTTYYNEWPLDGAVYPIIFDYKKLCIFYLKTYIIL